MIMKTSAKMKADGKNFTAVFYQIPVFTADF